MTLSWTDVMGIILAIAFVFVVVSLLVNHTHR